MGRKIAILGKAPDSLPDAPLTDQTWEIWSINDSLYREQIPRADRHFELHPINWTKEPEYDKYYDWLCAQTELPIYLQSAVEEIKSGVVYPLATLIQHFAGPGADYYTNSIAYMVSLAIMELDMRDSVPWDLRTPRDNSEHHVGLWGVNMAQHGVGNKSEYAAQRPSCEFWIGIARGRGYTVHIPRQSDLLASNCLYGFDQGGRQFEKLRAREKELKQRISVAEQNSQHARDEAIFLRGALESLHYDKQWLHVREEVK